MLQLKNVSIVRGGTKIVKNVNLKFKEGNIHVLLGANGSGKSTLAQGIMGVFPVEGEIYLGDERIDSLSIHERARMGITLAFQEPARFEGIRVKDYLLLSSKSKRMSEIEEVIKMVGLPKPVLFQTMDESLSGGERKRIELAAVILMKPKFAILDEIDSGIDMVSFKRIGKAITIMKRAGTGVILITHNEDMINLGDLASIICRGEIIKTGAPRDIRNMFTSSPCPALGVKA